MQSRISNDIRDEQYMELLSKVRFSPIFIMGDHRSGTTLLYKTLAATECFNFLKAYHIIEYERLLLNYVNKTENQVYEKLVAQFKSLGISDRVFDRIEVTPNLPEEYGFVLKNHGYEAYLNPDNLSLFTNLCRKIQFISDSDRPILLKNPWCFLHFMYIKNSFPEARFIFIHRHPIHVMNSKLKALRMMLSQWSAYTSLISKRYRKIFDRPLLRLIYQLMYSKYFSLGVNRVTQQSFQSTNYFLNNIELLPKSDYISIKYEDLCQQPKANIVNILDFLELEGKRFIDYDNLIQPRPLNLLPEVQNKYEQICKKLQPYLTYNGYENQITR